MPELTDTHYNLARTIRDLAPCRNCAITAKRLRTYFPRLTEVRIRELVHDLRLADQLVLSCPGGFYTTEDYEEAERGAEHLDSRIAEMSQVLKHLRDAIRRKWGGTKPPSRLPAHEPPVQGVLVCLEQDGQDVQDDTVQRASRALHELAPYPTHPAHPVFTPAPSEVARGR